MTPPLYTDPAHQPFRLEAGDVRALLIPGFLGTPKEMRPIGEELAAAGISASGVLLPGFGPDIARLGKVRAEDWIAAAAEAWQEERARGRRTLLVGFSMGGAVALAVAERVGLPDAAVLLAPHWKFADRRAMALPVMKHVLKEFRPFEKADFSDPGTRATFAEMAPGVDLDDPAMQDRLRRESVIPTRTLDELRRIGAMAAKAAPRVTAAATFLQGRQDPTVLPAFTRQLARKIGGPAEVDEFDGGHMLVDPTLPSWQSVRAGVLRAAEGVS